MEKPQVKNIRVEKQALQGTDLLLRAEQRNSNIESIVEYLNKKASTNYKPSSKKTKDLIKARFNESFTLDDFKTVIDNKTAEWLHDHNMNKYLRPETLFGPKFESYLNQKVGAHSGQNNQPPKDEFGLGF